MGAATAVLGLGFTEVGSVAAVANPWLAWGMAGQFAWAGISSARDVSSAYGVAEKMCEQNAKLEQEKSVVNKAITAGTLTTALVDQLRETAGSWQGQISDMQGDVIKTRKEYLAQFTYFLGFLAFITTMMFFALEKKGGRLDRLFAKIDKINALTNDAA